MLSTGGKFPQLTLSLPRGGKITVPADFGDSWAYVAFFRGHWCSYCNRHLARIQENIALFERMGVKVLAASADGEAEIRKLTSDHKLSFPVAYGVTQADIKALGAFTGERQGNTYIQPTEFILRPGGETAAAMYSSAQLGRMDSREVLEFLKSRVGAKV
jgi:peroxiredoxin